MDAVAATEDACGMARPWSLGLPVDKYTGIADENTTTTKKKLKHKGNGMECMHPNLHAAQARASTTPVSRTIVNCPMFSTEWREGLGASLTQPGDGVTKKCLQKIVWLLWYV